MPTVTTLPPRSEVPTADRWDLSSLYATDADWEAAFAAWEATFPGYAQFRGTLAQGPGRIAELMRFDAACDRAGEALGTYAFLRTAEDQGDSGFQRMKGRYEAAATKAGEAASFVRPELMAVPPADMDRHLQSPELADWRLALDRILRYRPHTLGPKEEQLIAMQGQMSGAASAIFRQLNDADLKWPQVDDGRGGRVELGHSSFSAVLHAPDRDARRAAFHTYYGQFEAHKNTIAAALNGSVQKDVYYAKARGYPSARRVVAVPGQRAGVGLRQPDRQRAEEPAGRPQVLRPPPAGDEAGRRHPRLRHLRPDPGRPGQDGTAGTRPWTWSLESLAPAGDGLHAGAPPRHDDRPVVRPLPERRQAERRVQQRQLRLRAVHPHELPAGRPRPRLHADARGRPLHAQPPTRPSSQPYQYHGYTIFVAEVASTFNEHAAGQAHDGRRPRPTGTGPTSINRQIDGIRGTIVRQTMFAEFERVTHDLVEAGEPLTVDALRGPSTASCSTPTSAPASSSTRNWSWSASASRTSTARSTSTSTPPASAPPSPSASASPPAASPNWTPTSASSRAAAAGGPWTCSAGPASTWKPRGRWTRRWGTSSGW